MWPIALFFNIVAIAVFAAYIIRISNNDMVNHKTDNRGLFLQELCETSSLSTIKAQFQNVQAITHFSTKPGFENMLKKSFPTFETVTRLKPSPKNLKRDETGRIKFVCVTQMCLLEAQKRYRKTRKNVNNV